MIPIIVHQYSKALILAFCLFFSHLALATITISDWTAPGEGGCNGTIEIIATGTAGPFTLSIHLDNNPNPVEGQPQPDDVNGVYTFENLCSGLYNIRVMNAYRCETTLTINLCGQPIPSPRLPQITAATNCDNNNGSIDFSYLGDVTVYNGTPPYTWEWSNGDMGIDLWSINNLSSGYYGLIIRDANRCQGFYSFYVPYENDFNASFIAEFTETGECSGSITGTVSGGTPPYQFILENSGNAQQVVGNSETYTFSGLCEGTYTLEIKDSEGCSKRMEVHLKTCETITLKMPKIKPVSNCKEANGEIFFGSQPVGGEAPYTYSWSNGSTELNLSGLSVGSYILTVEDNKGCTAEFNYLVPLEGGNAAPSLGDWVIKPDSEGNCTGQLFVPVEYTGQLFDVSLTLNEDGPGFYEYQFLGDPPYEHTFEGLCQGLYKLTFAVSHPLFECEATCVEIEIPGPCKKFTIKGSPEITKPSSCSADDGNIRLGDPNGGTPPYQWLWSTGADSPNGISGLESGTYSVTILDADGCMLEQTFDLTVPSDAALVEITEVIQPNEGCDGKITVTGATGVVLSLYSEGELVLPPVTMTMDSYTFSSLCKGNYTLIAEDIAGCQSEHTATLSGCNPITIHPPVIGTPSDCASKDGTIRFTTPPSGVTGGFEMVLTNADGEVIPSGEGGCFGWCNLPEGTYTVTVTDKLGCTAQETYTLTSPETPSVFFELVIPECEDLFNGAIYLGVTGGSGSYLYRFIKESTGQVQEIEEVCCPEFEGLETGWYTIEMLDIKTKCSSTVRYFVEEIPSRGKFVIADYSTEKSCPFQNTGSITFFIEGGTPPYSISLQTPTGATLQESTGANPPLTAPLHFTDLAAGNYKTLKIVDDCGREVEQTYEIKVEEFPKMEMKANITQDCPGESSLDLVVSGGTPGYTFEWSGPGNFSSTNQNIDNLQEGNYTVKVTDSEMCYQEMTFFVPVYHPPVVNASATINYACPDYMNGLGNIGRIEITNISGGKPYSNNQDYLVEWSNGSTERSIEHLSPGSYSVTITDGCGSYPQDFTIQSQSVDYDPQAFTCFNNVMCGDYQIDIEWSGYSIQTSDLDAQRVCKAVIACGNGETVEIFGNETHSHYDGGQSGDICYCNEILNCNVDIYEVMNAYFEDVDGNPHEQTMVVDEVRNGTIEVETELTGPNIHGIGIGGCLPSQALADYNCGNDPSNPTCTKCIDCDMENAVVNVNEDCDDYNCEVIVTCGGKEVTLTGKQIVEWDSGFHSDFDCTELCHNGAFCKKIYKCNVGGVGVFEGKEELCTQISYDPISETSSCPQTCLNDSDGNPIATSCTVKYFCPTQVEPIHSFCDEDCSPFFGSEGPIFSNGSCIESNSNFDFLCKVDPLVTCFGVLAPPEISEKVVADGSRRISISYEILKDDKWLVSKVFPNPFNQALNIELMSAFSGEVWIQLYDIQGKEVFEASEKIVKGQNNFTIMLEGLTNGLYNLQVTDYNKNRYSQTVIFQQN